jgi:hypothetical protein
MKKKYFEFSKSLRGKYGRSSICKKCHYSYYELGIKSKADECKKNKIKEEFLVNLKKCTKCFLEKKFSEFYKSSLGKHGVCSICKACQRAINCNFRKKNSDKIKKLRDRCNWRDIKNVDGSSFMRRDFDILFAQQGGKCWICLSDKSGKKGWIPDHDHNTGFIRGILCNSCNLGLGLFKDKVGSFRRAIDYLERYENKTVHFPILALAQKRA